MKKLFIPFVFFLAITAGLVLAAEVSAAELSVPTLISPANNSSVSVSPTVSWSSVFSASQYQIEIKKTGSDTYSSYAVNSPITFLQTALGNNTQYEWRVKVCSDAGLSIVCSSWSDFRIFYIVNSSNMISDFWPAPTLISPINNQIVSTDTTISWYPAVGGLTYEYKIWKLTEDEPQLVFAENVSGTSVGGGLKDTINVLQPSLSDNSSYNWKVHICPSDTATKNGYGCGPWSEKWAFIKGSPTQLPAPTLTSPSNGSTVSKGSNSSATQTFVNLSWSSVVGANLYQYKIYNSSGQELYSYQTSSTSAGVGLDDGKTYKWKVRACNATTASDSTCGQWSQQWSFATGSGLNVDLKINDSDNPPSVVYGAKIKVSWASTGATKCIPMGHSVPVEGGQPWETGLYNLPLPGGTWTLYAQHSSFGYISPLEIGIQCFDANGKSVADSINLSVNPKTNVSPAITVVSPNGGESLMIGSQYKIKWTDNNGNPYIALALSPEPQGQLSSITIRNDVSNTGEFLWSVPSSVSVGKYYLSACSLKSLSENSGLCDKSDSYLNIVPAQLNSGDLVRSPSDPTVYVIKDGKKQPISSPQEFEQKGYKWDQIQTVQADLLAQIAELKAQVKQLKEDLAKAGALLKSMTGPDVYVIVDGKKEKIQDPETFNKRGYKWNQIQSVSQEDLESIPEYAPSAQQTATAPALPQGIIPGSLVKSPNSPAVYYITPTGAKKHILNSKVFNSYNNKWDTVRTVSQDEINASPTVNAFRIGNESKVYFISDGQKQWVKTPEAFAKKGLKWDQIVSVNKTEIDEYKEGEEIE